MANPRNEKRALAEKLTHAIFEQIEHDGLLIRQKMEETIYLGLISAAETDTALSEPHKPEIKVDLVGKVFSSEVTKLIDLINAALADGATLQIGKQ